MTAVTMIEREALVLQRERLKDRITKLGAGSAQALERTKLQAELTVLNSKLREINVQQAARDRVSAEQRRHLGKLEHAANTAEAEWAPTWAEDRHPLTRGELARMVVAVRMSIGTPEEAEAIQAVLASGQSAIRWLCENVRGASLQKLITGADSPVKP
jgi:hypothetical protein